jgi:hypothetical protein
MSQNILAADLVVQGIEAIAGFCLRFRVQRHLQLLKRFGVARLPNLPVPHRLLRLS